MGCWTYGNRVGVSRWSLVSSFGEGLGVRSLLVVRFCVIGWLNVSVKPCMFCSSVFFCEKKNNCETCWGVFSLTELTELTEPFCARFEPTERLRHTEVTEAFQLTLAVRFCDIGWLNVSVKLCVFCSSVFFCEKKSAPTLWDDTQTAWWGVFSLTELTDLTEPFCAHFEPTEGLRHTDITERFS